MVVAIKRHTGALLKNTNISIWVFFSVLQDVGACGRVWESVGECGSLECVACVLAFYAMIPILNLSTQISENVNCVVL